MYRRFTSSYSDWCVLVFHIEGHNIAKLDPLGISEADLDSSIPPELIVDNSLNSEKVQVDLRLVLNSEHSEVCTPLVLS